MHEWSQGYAVHEQAPPTKRSTKRGPGPSTAFAGIVLSESRITVRVYVVSSVLGPIHPVSLLSRNLDVHHPAFPPLISFLPQQRIMAETETTGKGDATQAANKPDGIDNIPY